ncbi:hypothetical protein FOA52_008764 [Chlamydomonas sp. UWO 241]|nr:hypothetical protein FOA52_008764 [Chlamydomonas sp. UWO 241]
MRDQVDVAVQVVASPASGASSNELGLSLVRWPRIVDLTLLAVGDASDLAPMSTASLASLTHLTIRQAPQADTAWDMPVASNNVAATLCVIDISGCDSLRSIDFVRSCVQLGCLWMPGCDDVSDMSPLGACREMLEELWMAGNAQICSLTPLAACARLRKLDLLDCVQLHDQVAGLQLTCTQLAAPSLRPDAAGDVQEAAARVLCALTFSSLNQTAFASSGGIPSLVRLLGPDSSAHMHEAAASVLQDLVAYHSDNQTAIASAGVILNLVRLLGPDVSEGEQQAAASALENLADLHVQNQVAIAAAGAIPPLVFLLGPESSSDVQEAAAGALCYLACKHAQNQASITDAGALPALLQLLNQETPADVQERAARALCALIGFHDPAIITTDGGIPALVQQMLGPDLLEDMQAVAAWALRILDASPAQKTGAIASAGTVPALVQLAQLRLPEVPADVQMAATDELDTLSGSST